MGIKSYSLEEIKDENFGKVGTPKRDKYEYELKMDILGEMVKQARKEKNLTQQELGEKIGVKKSQISKIERNVKDVRFSTIFKLFEALNTKIAISIDFAGKKTMKLS